MVVVGGVAVSYERGSPVKGKAALQYNGLVARNKDTQFVDCREGLSGKLPGLVQVKCERRLLIQGYLTHKKKSTP